MQNNVEMIQQAFGDFGKGNFQAIADRCTNDVSWGTYENPAVPYAGMFTGKDGVLKFFRSLQENIDYTEFTPREFYAQGDTVIVRGHHEGRVKKTGRSFRHEWAMFFTIRDSRIASFFVFQDSRDQAQAFAKPSGNEAENRFERPGETIPQPAQSGAPRRSR